jgi:hypothetical protein
MTLRTIHLARCAPAAALLLATLPALASPENSMTAPAQTETKPRDLDTHHIFTPPSDRKTWEARARRLRAQILFSAGLWPMPEKTPLKPLVTGRIEGPDYVIENVAIETLPGFYLCGNLYRPKGKKGPFPAIANPHGHWATGRLEMQSDVPKAAPPPAPPADGRGNLVAIGVNLARQGFVVFAYDMTGYNDTNQVDHKFAGDLRHWLWGVSLMGLQLWNSIRAVDYLQSLPDVDKKRIGVTGASGGGTQTFLLCAVDDRVKAAVPVNMVSADMQGGCLCENGPGLRVGTDNVEIAALMAPKPLLLVSCTGDWTKNVPHAEWPAIRKVYDLYGAGDKTAVAQFNYGHNYNIESREAMYAWFGKWLLNDPNPEHFREKPFEVDTKAMRVWNERHPMPTDALKEPQLTQALIARSEKQLASLWPKDAAGLKRFQATMRPALQHSLSLGPLPPEAGLAASSISVERSVLIVGSGQDEKTTRMESVFREKGLKVSTLVLPSLDSTRERLWDKFFSCYNQTELGDRVAGVLDELTRLQAMPNMVRVDLIGVGPAGIWALLARALSSGEGRTVVDCAGFASGDDDAYINALYAPGLRRAGDVRAAAVLCAPGPLCLFNTGDAFQTDAIAAAYRALRAPLRVEKGGLSAEEVAAWISAR